MAGKVNILSQKELSNNHYSLEKVKFELEKKDGTKDVMNREVYYTPNAVTVLLYNKQRQTVVLTKQFRIVTYLNGNNSGMLLETCAGILEHENESAADGVKREIEEETGFKIDEVENIFNAYSTPGAVTELLHYFIAEYSNEQRVSEGGGLEEEHEDIQVIEMPFTEAYNKIANGEIKDGKTIILLQYAKINIFKD